MFQGAVLVGSIEYILAFIFYYIYFYLEHLEQ